MVVGISAAKRSVRAPSITIAALGAVTLLLAVRSPHAGGYGLCPILALTGYQCPTCGGLRAVHDLTHLDIHGAWIMNPLVTLAVPLAALLLGGWWWRSWRSYPAGNIPFPAVIIGVVVLIGFGILRNF